MALLIVCGVVQGKTLAFVLPILESLINGPAKSKRKNGYGRPPSVLVLLPTRELAKQVINFFEMLFNVLKFGYTLNNFLSNSNRLKQFKIGLILSK